MSFDLAALTQYAYLAFFMLMMFTGIGQRLQLQQMLSQIKKKMDKLAVLRDSSYKNLRGHIAKFVPNGLSVEQEARLGNLITSIAIPPVANLDPAGIVPKMENTFKTYEKYMKNNLSRIVGNVSQSDLENVTNSLEVAVELDIFHRVVDHFYRQAKKGGVMGAYMLIMALPQLMEMAEALFTASAHFQSGLPIGDTFGPMVASKFGGTDDLVYSDVETTVRNTEVSGRKIFAIKAKGPGGSVGNPGIVTQKVIQVEKPSLVVTIDAALRMESEKTGDVAEGVGVAMGGPGMDRYRIEEALAQSSIPILTVVCKMNLKEAISQMPKVVLDQVQPVYERVIQLIRENSESGDTVIIVGVGNSMGCI